MSTLLDKLTRAKSEGITVCVALNCNELMVKVENVHDEVVTLRDTNSGNKYYLHYTAVILCGTA